MKNDRTELLKQLIDKLSDCTLEFINKNISDGTDIDDVINLVLSAYISSMMGDMISIASHHDNYFRNVKRFCENLKLFMDNYEMQNKISYSTGSIQ